MSASQLSNLKNHLVNEGITKLEHKLKGKPSNSRGKKHVNSTRASKRSKAQHDADGVEVNEVEIENGSEEAEAEVEEITAEEAEEQNKDTIAYLIPAYIA